LSHNLNIAYCRLVLNLSNPKWDAFICHASEDKAQIARPLANCLTNQGLNVWYDEFTLKVGDSLTRKIDTGLRNSDFGIVILSKNFFLKNWPQAELDGLYAKAMAGTRKVILPVWHDITMQEVYDYSPTLVDLVGLRTRDGIDKIAGSLKEEIREEQHRAGLIIQGQSSSYKNYENGYRAGVIKGQQDIDAFWSHQLSGLSGDEAPPCPLPTDIEYCKGWKNGYTAQVTYQMDDED
jgi:TIR domain